MITRRILNSYWPDGDGAALSLDFTSGSLPGGVTFTRAANTATRINASGLIETINADQPRFDHTTSGTPLGLLVENAATNLVPQSNFASAWLGGSATTTRTANTTDVLSPDGTNNAAKITIDSNGFASRFEIVNGLAASTTYTFSYYIRGSAGFQGRVYNATSNTDAYPPTVLTYSNTGWTRVQMQFTTGTQTGGIQVFVYCVHKASATTSDVIYIYGAQLEAGATASSLIPTTTSTATRNPDICTVSGAAFSSWYTQSEGTFYADFRRRRVDNTATVLSANDNTTSETIDLTASGVGSFTITDGGSTQVSLFRSPFSVNTNTKIAAAFKANDCNMAMANSIAGGDTSATIPTVDRLFIGRDAGAVPTYLDGHIRSIKFWNKRRSDSEIQELTQ